MGSQCATNQTTKLLITGGAGFIDSLTALELLEAGHELQVFDDLSNSSPIALERVREVAGLEATPRLRQMEGKSVILGILSKPLSVHRPASMR